MGRRFPSRFRRRACASDTDESNFVSPSSCSDQYLPSRMGPLSFSPHPIGGARRLPTILVVAAAMAAPLTAQGQSDSVAPTTLTVGERLTYDVKFGPIRVGGANMEVLGVEEVRGR